jgi:hypothetical protein
MTTIENPVNKDALSRSLPLVRQHQHALIERLAYSMGEALQDGSPLGREEVAATLAELLIGQVERLADSGTIGRLDGVAQAHRALGIDGRHYSRFGDSLVPILVDLLGPNVPREIPSAWCDAFWLVIRSIPSEPQRRRA